MFLVGAILSSPVMTVVAFSLFVYIIFSGIVFRRNAREFEKLTRCESTPRTIESTVGLRNQVETVISNNSERRFKITGFHHVVTPTISEETEEGGQTLGPYQKLSLESTIRIGSHGTHEIRQLAVNLEHWNGLFRHQAKLPDQIVATIRPLVERNAALSNTVALHDLTIDRYRKGAGTELAVIRPANSSEDFRRIHWRASARTGRLMAKEFYSEKDPTIMLLIDASASMRTPAPQGSVFDALTAEVANFLATAAPAGSSTGLIMFDETRVLAIVDPRAGADNRERILRELLIRGSQRTSLNASPQVVYIGRSNDTAIRMQELQRILDRTDRKAPLFDRLSSFASNILPFYSRAMSNRFRELRKKGAFAAFEATCELGESALVIAITDGKTNWNALYEGSRKATVYGHRVLIVIVSHTYETEPRNAFSEKTWEGVRTINCHASDIWTTVNSEIIALSRGRGVPREVIRPRST